MNFRVVKYLLVLVTPLLVAISLSGHLWTTFLAPAVLFGLLPLMELFTQGSTENLSAVEEEMVKKDARYDLILYALVPVQY